VSYGGSHGEVQYCRVHLRSEDSLRKQQLHLQTLDLNAEEILIGHIIRILKQQQQQQCNEVIRIVKLY